MASMKPADIKDCCENESMGHKVKIVGFSLLMFGIATSYSAFFDNLVYRSGIFQQRALAREENFTDFRNKYDPYTLRTLDSTYFQPSSSWIDAWEAKHYAENYEEKTLTWSEARWDEWETMHDGVIWFDTAGCLDGGFIGQVNDEAHYSRVRRLDSDIHIGFDIAPSQSQNEGPAVDRFGGDPAVQENNWQGTYQHGEGYGYNSQSGLDAHNTGAASVVNPIYWQETAATVP